MFEMKHVTGMETCTKIFFWCIFNLVAILTVQFDDVTVKTIYNFLWQVPDNLKS